MKIRTNVEDWREIIVTCTNVDESHQDEAANELCKNVLYHLNEMGVNYTIGHQQTVGAFAILQQATDKEKEIFGEILAREVDKLNLQ